jgi:hypothetical protein
MYSRFLALAISVFGTGLTAAFGFALPAQSQEFREWTASRRAVNTCVWVAQSQGFPVLEVLNQNNYAGESKVVMRVQEQRGSTTLGCDYGNTGRVQLYRLTERRSDWNAGRYGRYDRGHWDGWSDDWDNASSDERENNRWDNHWDNRWDNHHRHDDDWNNNRDNRGGNHWYGSWNDDRHRTRWNDRDWNDRDDWHHDR